MKPVQKSKKWAVPLVSLGTFSKSQRNSIYTHVKSVQLWSKISHFVQIKIHNIIYSSMPSQSQGYPWVLKHGTMILHELIFGTTHRNWSVPIKDLPILERMSETHISVSAIIIYPWCTIRSGKFKFNKQQQHMTGLLN